MDAALQAWSVQDFRDLQVLFNLAWTDPDFLAVEPLRALVEHGRGYAEADKAVGLAVHRRIVREVIPLHRRLWEEGRIEVTTTPLAHPILPLIADTDFGIEGDPGALLPEHRYREIIDADQQVILGLDVAERLLGRRPVGMWPAKGAVAQLVMSLFSKNGVRWVATGEDVLAMSLGIAITRDGDDTVEQSELFRPWQATLRRNPPVPIFFRDVRLSDLIGFEYSGMAGSAAAADFMRRLRNVRDRLDAEGRLGGERPPVVSVILDGENAWEHYANDGNDFLNALYRRLSEAGWVATITPSEYLERFAEPEPLGAVFPASWFQPNFATWFGEEEEALAWDYLWRVRDDLRRAERSGAVADDALAAAYESMLFAEGSDWFWWYGSDQESGDDGYFDRAFRELLGQVYDHLDRARPRSCRCRSSLTRRCRWCASRTSRRRSPSRTRATRSPLPDHLIFAFEVRSPIANPWGSPRGLSVQTFDVYVDTDPGTEGGARLLLPGRNAALPAGHGWEYAVTVEGWESALYVAGADGRLEERQPSFDLVVFPAKGRVVLRLPRELFPEGDPAAWGYAAALLSQEGFPSSGVRRVRDVEPSAAQWRIGGGSPAVNQTRILDAAWPEAGVQEEMLSRYPAATGSIDGLTADDFGRIPLLVAD